jgi:hypothetical protein
MCEAGLDISAIFQIAEVSEISVGVVVPSPKTSLGLTLGKLPPQARNL